MSNRKPENAENVRKRVAADAARKRAAGLTKICVWAPADSAQKIRDLAAQLRGTDA